MATKVYQLKIHLEKVSPMIWRRLLVKDTTSIAQLHGIFQLVLGWENIHLHCFRIYGKDYGIYYIGGMSFSNDPREVQLKDFNFRANDKFYMIITSISIGNIRFELKKFWTMTKNNNILTVLLARMLALQSRLEELRIF